MKPFDLEAAKRGEPLITRDGRPAKFVAHVPECAPGWMVYALVDTTTCVTDYYENGRRHVSQENPRDLFMAPRKVVKWGNAFKRSVDGSLELHARWFDTAREATNYFGDAGMLARVEFEE